MKTFSLKKEQINKNWLVIDAEKAVLGRLAVISANILRGKNKPEYTPNQDCGDHLIIINSDKVALTCKKESDKIYSYENKIIATDGKTWSWETIFVGRWETKFKIYPLLLQEVEQMTQLV